MMVLFVLELAMLLCTALMVGQEFSGWAVVHRSLNQLPFEHNQPAEQAIYRGYGRLMPVLMPLTSVLAIASLLALPGPRGISFALTALGIGCLLVALGITLGGNMPINRQIWAATPEMDPDVWWTLRRRWDRWHSVRLPFELAALTLLIGGGLLAPIG